MKSASLAQILAHKTRAALALTIVLLGIVFSPAVARASAPTVGAITALTPTGGQNVGIYEEFEVSFPVTTSAVNLQIPYDPVAPPYAANLKPNEDARNGISVDALLLPPGQTNWATAETWPCYYQQDYDSSFNPLGTSAWHLRFAPTQLGTWTYEIRATDANGTVTTAPVTFTCVASASKGFVEVSPTDSRYFQYDNGAPFLAGGMNVGSDMTDFTNAVNSFSSADATGLLRIWTGAFGGLGIIGGFGQTKTSDVWSYNPDPNDIQITAQDAHSGRYSLKLVPGTNGLQASLSMKSGDSYTFSAWVEAFGTDSGAQFTLFDRQNGNPVNLAMTVTPGSGWQHAVWTIPAGANLPSANTLTVNLTNSSGGYLLMDDVTVTDQSTGADLMGPDGGFDWQCTYNQRQSAIFDAMVNKAQANGQYLKAVVFDKYEDAFSMINDDGTSNSNAATPSMSLGGSANPSADTPVQRLQGYYARYLMARWGYATAIQSWEYTNEMDYNYNLEYAGAQSFAAHIHSYTAEGRRLVTSSTALNDAGQTYDPNFYENAALYPDIDYADYHFYPGGDAAYGPYLPYDDVSWSYNCRGFERSTTGGPNGLGELTASASNPDYAPGDPNNMMNMIDVYRVVGAGTWTIKFWYKTSPDVVFSPGSWWITGGDGIDLYQTGSDVQFSLPWNETPDAPVTNWTEYSATFHTIGPGIHPLELRMRGNTVAGSVSFSDVRLYAPDGSLWTRVTFNEPTIDKDSASLVEYTGLSKETYSGEPSIGKPIIMGECDPFPLVSDMALDTNDVYVRQATWAQAVGASGMIAMWWSNLGGELSSPSAWQFQGGVQRFMQGVPLTNGKFRDLGATSSATLRVIGQKDAQDGLGVLWVQNAGHVGDGSDAANWYNLTLNPSLCTPVNGTISVPGLADGAYQVQYWNTVTGQVVGTSTLTTSSGALTIPVNALAQDAAIKFQPATAPNLTLQLTASSATALPGQTVTYTLKYTNTGSSPALAVSVPWSVPSQMQYLSSQGGTYNASQNVVTWNLGTVAQGASGTVTLTVRAK